MNKRRLGRTDLPVSQIGFGCLRLAGTSTEYRDRSEVMRTLAEACNAGVNFFDTADAYGQGRSEQILGEALKGSRSEVLFATKVGYVLTTKGSVVAALKPLVRPLVRTLAPVRRMSSMIRQSQLQQDFRPKYVERAVDGSLKRLQTDYIDLLQLHNPPPDVLESGDYLETLMRIRAQGKIRWFGVACAQVSDAKVCLRFSDIATIQLEMNIANIEQASLVASAAAQRGIGVIAREPFGAGRLIGGISGDISSQYTQVEDCLRAVLDVPFVSTVLVGMSSRKHLRDNLAALKATCS